MTHLFTQPLSGISGQRMVDSLDGQSEMERPITLCTVGCLTLQLRVIFDDGASAPEPDTEQWDNPNLWQAVGIEVAVCLYGDVLARESIWGVWMYLGNREDTTLWTFPATLKEEVERLTAEACTRLGTVIAQRLDRLHSAESIVRQHARYGIYTPGAHVSVSV
jgi:hypothetical protein